MILNSLLLKSFSFLFLMVCLAIIFYNGALTNETVTISQVLGTARQLREIQTFNSSKFCVFLNATFCKIVQYFAEWADSLFLLLIIYLFICLFVCLFIYLFYSYIYLF